MAITEQLLSRTSHTTDGTTTAWSFSFSGGYLLGTHVKAYTTDSSGVQTPVTGTLTGPFTLLITPAIAAGKTLTIYRDTPKAAPMVDFANETGFSEVALDTNAKQAVFAAAEALDASVYGRAYAKAQADLAASFAAAANSSANIAASYTVGGPAASAWMSTSHTIPNGITVPAQFQTKEFDTDNCFNDTGATVVVNAVAIPAYSFAPNKAGYYFVSASVALPSGTNYIMLYKNGAEYKRFTSSAGSGLVFLNGTTDYVGVSVYQNVGTSQSTINLQAKSWFQACFMRPS